MSTSDAAELELRVGGVGGGETATPQCATARSAWTTTASEHQDNTFLGRFTQENQNCVITSAEQHPSAFRQEENHKADSPSKDKACRWGHSEVQIQSVADSILVTSLILRLSKPKLGLEKTLEAWSSQHLSLVDPQPAETKKSTLQVNETSSSSSIERTILYPTTKTNLFSTKKEEELLSVVNHDVGITRNLSRTHILSNSNTGAHEHNDLCRLPCESQPRCCPGSLTGTKTDIKHQTNLEKQLHFGDHSDEPLPMLSSTMVTVLAPQWGGRLRRTKRFDGTGYSEAQGDVQEVANTSSNHQQGVQGSQHSVKNVLTNGSNIPRRVLGTRSNTVGWSSKSDPSSLDLTKKDMIPTVSLDLSSLSPSATSPTSRSPFSRNLNEQRVPQMDLQGRQSFLSSNPTTSSFLQSFRRFNPKSTNSSQTPVLPVVKPSSLSSSLNNNTQERPKSILSPSSVSYRTTDTRPVLSPVGSIHREKNVTDKFLFLTSPTNSTRKGNSCPQQSQPVQMIQTSCATTPLQGKGPLEKQQNCENLDNMVPFSESSISPTRYFQHDNSTPLKTHTLPRRTNLKSTSWWKQVSQEGSSSLCVKNTNNKKDYQKTDSLCLTDNKRLGSYILNNDKNNTLELACKDNLNLSLKTRSPESEKAAIQQHALNVDNREPQKPQSMPDCRSASKLSTVSAQITLRQTKVPDKTDEKKPLCTAHVPAPTSFNPPTDSFGKYSGSPTKTTSASTSQDSMDTQKLTKLPLFHDYSTTPSSQPHPSQTTADHSSGPNTKNTFSFQPHQVSSNTNTNIHLL
ncbi:uncharacterized protein FYW61_016399 [Anableps anableps]